MHGQGFRRRKHLDQPDEGPFLYILDQRVDAQGVVEVDQKLIVGFGQQEDRASLDSLRADPNFDENKSARWLMAAGARDGFAVLPLSPAFRAASLAANGRPLWFGRKGVYGHWNSEGHGVTARAMERYFARTLGGLDTTGTTPVDVPGLAELERR